MNEEVEAVEAAVEAQIGNVRIQVGKPLLAARGIEVHARPLTKCFSRDGRTGRHSEFGDRFSETFKAGIGLGYRCVNVLLAGWEFDYLKKDHHIDRIGIRISKVSYNSATGEVSFTVSGVYADKNYDDDYTWEAWFTITAFG